MRHVERLVLARTVALAVLLSVVAAAGSLVVGGTTASGDERVDVAERAVGVNRPRQVTIISDSAMAGVRWNGALGGFRGFDAVPLLESCRRVVHRSCNGREGYRPRTAYEEILAQPRAVDREALVIATGYNDYYVGFEWQVRAVLDAARSKGYDIVAWVTYRELVNYTLPRDQAQRRSNYQAMNQQVRNVAASGDYPELRIWDLNRYTARAPGWFHSDGVHETWLGSWGVADWVSRQVAALDGRPCAEPWRPGWKIPERCPDPDPLPATIGLPDILGLYP